MKKDKHKTKVIFLKNTQNNETDIFAFFPNEHYFDSNDTLYNYMNMFTSYSHIGQHSVCCLQYALESKKATIDEYSNLFTELCEIGYNLEIIN